MALMTAGISMLARRTKQAAGVSITYKRRDGETLAGTITAVEGETPFRFTDAGGYDVLTRRRDFILDTASLVTASEVAFEPASGDEISRVIGTQTHRYLVGAPNDEPAFRYQDPAQTRVRIHTHEEIN